MNELAPVKSMKGKYDGRRKNGNPGHITHLIKSRLGHSRARYYLREIDKHKSPLELFQEALNNKQLALAWQIRIDMHDRAHGKPFTSINPHEQAKPLHDNRIQIAIQQLLPPSSKHGGKRLDKVEPRLLEAEEPSKHPKLPGEVG